MLTGAQIRAARKLLGCDRGKIVKQARGVTTNTVAKAEGFKPGSPPRSEQLASIREVVEAAGVEFTNGDEPGVRLRKATIASARAHTKD